MQTSTRNQDRSTSRDVAATARLAIMRGAFALDQPGSELSVVDGLVSVTQRAWRLDLGVGKHDAGLVVAQ